MSIATAKPPRKAELVPVALISLGLIAVKPGRGNWANEYLPALPRKVIAAMVTAAIDDDAPPF